MKTEAILEAVRRMRVGQFKATAIKVELEADLDRGSFRGNCSSGQCDGDTCYSCEEWNYDASDEFWGSEQFCRQWILQRLEVLGLSKWNKDISRFQPVKPLAFAKFYNDQSVDSEFTFTLLLNKNKNVLLLPKIVEAFKDMADAMGADLDTFGAGMHIALINRPKGYYDPTDQPTDTEMRRFRHFRKSMQPLLPALYFLGSHDRWSRNLKFRAPKVEYARDRHFHGTDFYDRDKYSAVAYVGRALEFRVFETCYDNPEAILDNVVTMSRCLRYWRGKYKDPKIKFEKNELDFGITEGDTLERLYVSAEHIELLNAGLRRLKPPYYTVKELKRQRQFNTNKTKINGRVRQAVKRAELTYREYEERCEEVGSPKLSKRTYINRKIKEATNPHLGDFKIRLA